MLAGNQESWQGEGEGLSGRPEGLSGRPEGLSGKPESLSGKPESLYNNLARNALLDQLPGQLAARVGALGQRHPPEDVRELVVALCGHRAWKAEELAILLARNPKTIGQNYLRPLLMQKRIEMTLPSTPSSPQQAYRSAEGNES